MTSSRRTFAKMLSLAVAGEMLAQQGRAQLSRSSTLDVDGYTTHVSTPEMEVDFIGLGLARIHCKRTGVDFLKAHPDAHLILNYNLGKGEMKNGLVMESDLAEVRKISLNKVQVEYKPLTSGLPGAGVTGQIELLPEEGTVLFGAEANLDQPGLSAIIHPLRDLDNRNELLLPVFSGVRFTGPDYAQLFIDPSTRASITAKPVRMKQGFFPWPNVLSGCFLFYKVGQDGFWLRSEDEKLLFKLIHFEQTESRIHLSVGTTVSGRGAECRQFQGARWKLQLFSQDWRRSLDAYTNYLQADSPAWKYHKNRIGWVDEIRLVLNQFKVVDQDKNGQAFDNPELIQEDLLLLKKLGELIPPRQVIIYPFLWQLIPMEYGTGVGYPDWTPSPLFAKLAGEARRMGYRVMPHLNYFAISPKNPHYGEFEPYILRDPITGAKMGWLFDEAKQRGMAYLHPAAPGWFELQARLVKKMLASMPVDAIFWDQTLNMLNAENFVVRGRTTLEGTMDFLRRMREEFPDIAFGGEGVTELTVPYQDFVQAHTPGIYALTPFNPDSGKDFHWGLNPQTFPMYAPMVHRLYSQRARLVGYAAEPDTRSPSFPDWLHLMKDYGLVTSITGLTLEELANPQGLVARTIRRAAGSRA